ncbi:MAG TPA: type III-A CRISPR-associated protein Cas10/Csm1, partial [Tissierellaceae bacterium]|nr:type III-A CRISPR-associated protein Cas10/Csm1 [Tissierellaceae bacterium]
MYERIDVAVKGSLLHDIGKIVFRNDRSGGNHSNAGAEFIANELINMDNKEQVIECIKYHHHGMLKNAGLDNSSMAYIVYEADNIASGLDRRLIYEESQNQAFDEKTPLHSVFNQLNIHRNDRKGGYKLKPSLMQKGVIIPEEDLQSLRVTTSQGGYGEIVSIIKKSLSEMSGNLDSPNSLLKLLESTASGVPSSTSTKEIPDISIYDHSKITCALASCMYIYAEENNIKDYKKTFFESRKFRKEKSFLLVSGDVSGIQDFIYTIASKGALRSLRGRSLYLEIMTENAIDDILGEVGLTRANLIYSGGGHFYMLLPNTDKTKEIIQKSKKEINRQLLEMFSISLYIEMDYVECTADEIGNGLDIKVDKENLIGEIYAGVSRKLSRNKLQRYKSGELTELFDPDSPLNTKTQHERECVICGESDNLVPFQKDKDTMACRNCDSLASLGTKVARIHGLDEKYLVVVKEDEIEGIRLPSLGRDKYLDIQSLSRVEANMKIDSESYIRVYSINEPMMGLNYSTNLWIGNYNKRHENMKAFEFGELASESCGIKRLGILRADVDDLGKAFTSGFEKKNEDKGKY